MNIYSTIILALTLSLQSPADAAPIQTRAADQINLLSFEPPQIYQDQLVVRVTTTTQAQLEALLPLIESVWSEATSVGPLDIQITREQLAELAKLNFPYEILIDDLQSHTNARWNQVIDTHRLQLQQQAHQEHQQAGAPLHDDAWFSNYKQLNEIADHLNNIITLRPDLASPFIAGQSVEGRDLFGITVTGPDTPENPQADRPIIFLFSTVHAREWIAPMTTSYFASKLAADYDTDPRVRDILDAARVFIVPVGNPDGYLYTWSHQRYWRKNRRNNNDGSFGVDINRNWGHEWGGPGSSGNSSSDTYRGPVPFSEPETSALRDTALSFGSDLIAHLEYHSYSQLVMYPWGYTNAPPPEPDLTYFQELTTDLASEIDSVHGAFYDPIQSAELYLHAGNSPDWFYNELGITSLLIELRPIGADFNPPPTTILPNAEENYQAIKRYIEHAIVPFSTFHAPTPIVEPGQVLELEARFINNTESLDPSSPTIYTRTSTSGPFTPTPMTFDPSSKDSLIYTYTTHPIDCGNILEYYIQASSTTGSTMTYPSLGANDPFRSAPQQPVTYHTDDLESISGWIVGHPSDTATSGIWSRVDPEPVAHDETRLLQPDNDHSPHGSICFFTDGSAGATPNDNDVDGRTSLISPRIDATRAEDTYVTFWYWFYRSTQFFDVLEIEISNDDGSTWSPVREYIHTGFEWDQVSIHIPSFIEPTNQIRLRFIAVDAQADHIVEAGIDDLQVTYLGCPSTNPADLNHDGALDFFDIQSFITHYSNNNPIADFSTDGEIDFFDITAFLTQYSN
ncbi:MAG: M14 family zinc carboxypeptidase [Phycisphaerales bacterium]